MNLYDGLLSIYEKYGFFYNKLISKSFIGIDGNKKITSIIERLRNGKVSLEYIEIIDYNYGIDGLPKSNVLKYILRDGWFAVRPSGTEPKIKIYFEMFTQNKESADRKINKIVMAILE